MTDAATTTEPPRRRRAGGRAANTAKRSIGHTDQMPWKIPTDRIGPPAWRIRPSWYQISERDQMINPQLQRMMAARMGATTITLDSSHASAVSCPHAVAELIVQACNSALQAAVV